MKNKFSEIFSTPHLSLTYGKTAELLMEQVREAIAEALGVRSEE